MLSVERLILEHEQLDSYAINLENCVRAENADAPKAIALKSLLSVALADHLRSEDAELYSRLAGSGEQALMSTADTLRTELAILKIDWAAYLEEWCDDAVHEDWATFGEETRVMMGRLRARIARENACLVPLALQRSHVRLRAA